MSKLSSPLNEKTKLRHPFLNKSTFLDTFGEIAEKEIMILARKMDDLLLLAHLDPKKALFALMDIQETGSPMWVAAATECIDDLTSSFIRARYE